MIEIKSLAKKYGDLTILQNISMQIPQGCIFGIVGQSGAGKSTLLRCLNGLESYDQGSIEINGTRLEGLSDRKLLEFRRGIGMIFQHFALLSRRTVLDNVKLPMECWKYDKSQQEKRAIELLERVGLSDKLYAMPDELSGGQKQRVAIARALALKPTILLCDEATSALDPAITQSILALLTDINRELGITIVMVTHEMSVIKAACDRVAILEAGHIVSQGLVEDVFLNDNAALQKLMGEKPVTAAPGQELIKVQIRGKEQQVIYRLAIDCGVPFDLLCANVTPFHNDCYMGHLYLTVPEGQAAALAAALAQQGVNAQVGKEF